LATCNFYCCRVLIYAAVEVTGHRNQLHGSNFGIPSKISYLNEPKLKDQSIVELLQHFSSSSARVVKNHQCPSAYKISFQAGVVGPFNVPVDLPVGRVHGLEITGAAHPAGCDQSPLELHRRKGQEPSQEVDQSWS